MSKLTVLNTKGEQVKDYALNKDIFGVEPNDAVLYDAITLTRNSLRQGTHDTKTRSEVSGGGRKPWAQKGTGRARQGSIRSPQWRHGGIVFGPHPRSYDKKMNRKESRLALKSALSYKVLEKALIVVENFELETSKTKDVLAILNNLNVNKHILIVVKELSDNLILATRNINTVVLLQANEINTYDVVRADYMIVSEDALSAIEEVLQ